MSELGRKLLLGLALIAIPGVARADYPPNPWCPILGTWQVTRGPVVGNIIVFVRDNNASQWSGTFTTSIGSNGTWTWVPSGKWNGTLTQNFTTGIVAGTTSTEQDSVNPNGATMTGVCFPFGNYTYVRTGW